MNQATQWQVAVSRSSRPRHSPPLADKSAGLRCSPVLTARSSPHLAKFWVLAWGGEVSDDSLVAEVERMAAGEVWTGADGFRELLDSRYLGTN